MLPITVPSFSWINRICSERASTVSFQPNPDADASVCTCAIAGATARATTARGNEIFRMRSGGVLTACKSTRRQPRQHGWGISPSMNDVKPIARPSPAKNTGAPGRLLHQRTMIFTGRQFATIMSQDVCQMCANGSKPGRTGPKGLNMERRQFLTTASCGLGLSVSIIQRASAQATPGDLVDRSLRRLTPPESGLIPVAC